MSEQQTPDREKKIAEIREALEKATPGTWHMSELSAGYLVDDRGKDITVFIEYNEDGSVHMEFENWQNNARLIANAPEWLRFLLEERERMKVEVGECQEHYFAMESMWFKALRENERLRRELEEAKAGAELEGQLVDDANSDLNEALGENGQLRQERDMYKSSSEVLYERLKKVAEQREKLIECLRFYERLARGREINDGGRRDRTILAEIGVTVE